ncbi:hypothetical protein [Streptomyces sp. NBC_00564]|uniref:hypothetical protein n=1 Tax=Streptomyces sp. NBC_00564 TaxID=2903663 RepID=UPI00352D7507|nr:hypothetical protein OG256_35970 [Streptomyces sp. NBC_00564]
MDAEDRWAPGGWFTTSLPEHLDRLAQEVLRAARGAARQLRQDSPSPTLQTLTLGILEGRVQAMLGPAFTVRPPVGAAAQEEFVRNAIALAVHVRAHSWTEKDLGAASASGQADVPHGGEIVTADAFDVLGRLMLPDSSPEGWTAALVTDVAGGDQTLEAVVKAGKYILHPTFLALTDDATRLIGEALHNINVDRLQKLARALAQPPDPEALQLATWCSSPPATPATYDSAVQPDAPTPIEDPPPPRILTTLPPRNSDRRRPLPLPGREPVAQPDSQPDAPSSLPPPSSAPSTYSPPESPESPSAR